MNASYALRLVLLSLAAFFFMNLTLGFAMSRLSRIAIRKAAALPAGPAANFLFALRVVPSLLAIVVVVAVCVPSYLWLEPEMSTEAIGGVCAAAAILALAGWGHSLCRTARAARKTARYLSQCRRGGQRTQAALVLDAGPPVIALAGVLRPEIVMSRDVIRSLPPEQVEAALQHELAHRQSRDNLKRLLLLALPDMAPGLGSAYAALDRGWACQAEWAADDAAAQGNAARSISLAEALVRVARMSVAESPAPLACSFASDDLSARVERLLSGNALREPDARWPRRLLAGVFAIPAIAVAVAVIHPAVLLPAHELLETLMR
jgi:Zn-dependent protease with chaperone function